MGRATVMILLKRSEARPFIVDERTMVSDQTPSNEGVAAPPSFFIRHYELLVENPYHRNMFRRVVILLLFMVLPLQALASVHMALSCLHQERVELSVSAGHDEHAAHHQGAGHTGQGQTQHHCDSCNLCIPPLSFHVDLAFSPFRSITFVSPFDISAGIIPRSFDRPPSMDSLA